MFSLSVPKLRGLKPRHPEVRPRSVETWLSQLPRADRRDSVQQLTQALAAQNRIALDADNRLRVMELYRPTVLGVARELIHGYAMASFPLSDGRRETVDMVDRLLAETANGYKIAANELAAQTDDSPCPQLPLALLRTMEFLGQQLLNGHQSYTSPPPGVWRDIHGLYCFAETRKLHKRFLKSTGPGRHAARSVRGVYRRILLMGAVNPYGLMRGECARVYDLADQWQELTQLSVFRELTGEEANGRFLIRLDSDLPPAPSSKARASDDADDMRMFDTIELVRDLHGQLKGFERGVGLRRSHNRPVPGADLSQADLLRRVGRVLGSVNVHRRSARAIQNVPLDLCIGINAIHFFTSDMRPFNMLAGAAGPHSTTADLEIPEEPCGEAGCESAQQPVDAGLAAPLREDWRNTHFRHFHCLVADESASGLRLQIRSPSDVSVRVGDPVGLQYPGARRWQLGVARWMRARNRSHLEVGIQMLAPEVRPVGVREQSAAGQADEQIHFVQALLLPANAALRQPETLLVPRGFYRAGTKLYLRGEGGESRLVYPFRTIDRTGSYDRLSLVSA